MSSDAKKRLIFCWREYRWAPILSCVGKAFRSIKLSVVLLFYFFLFIQFLLFFSFCCVASCFCYHGQDAVISREFIRLFADAVSTPPATAFTGNTTWDIRVLLCVYLSNLCLTRIQQTTTCDRRLVCLMCIHDSIVYEQNEIPKQT